MTDPRTILLVQCPDRPGIIAAISSFLFRHGANITDFDQHTSDDGEGTYFTRLEFQTERIDLQNMFNTRLANVVLDRTPASRGELGRERSHNLFPI